VNGTEYDFARRGREGWRFAPPMYSAGATLYASFLRGLTGSSILTGRLRTLNARRVDRRQVVRQRILPCLISPDPARAERFMRPDSQKRHSILWRIRQFVVIP